MSTSTSPQNELNIEVYHAPGIHRAYGADIDLVRSEVPPLLKYQPAFANRDVLDLGVGAGRTARFLEPLSARYECLDYSPVMVSYVKQTMPGISVRVGDIRDLSEFDDESFDFVFGSNNVISTVSHEDRLVVLGEVHRVLRPGGIFMFSAHNRRYRHALSGPRLRWSRNPVTLARNVYASIRSIPNHARVRHHRRLSPEYALLNDEGHEYAVLHYYIDRSHQERQLGEAGFDLLDVFDYNGQLLDGSHPDDDSPFMMYVARRSASGAQGA
jgi:SAM-dependent methyltransferase